MHTRISHYIELKTGVQFTVSLFGHSQLQFINLIPMLELFARGSNVKQTKGYPVYGWNITECYI